MNSAIANFLRRSSFLFILLAIALLLFGSVMRIEIAGMRVEIPDTAGRVVVWLTGLLLFYLGVTWKRSPGQKGAARSRLQAAAKNHDMRLASLFSELRDPELPEFVRGIAVGKAVSLRQCPDLRTGWLPSEVELAHRPGEFQMPAELQESFRQYYRETYRSQHGSGEDETLMLAVLPIVGSDRAGLQLSTQRNLYRYSQFYWNVVLQDSVRHRQALVDLFEHERITFPHNLCLHLVVLTKDARLLLTRRSQNVGTHANTWSCSLEENLKPADLNRDSGLVIVRGVNRALLEELGVKEAFCRDIRILSLFLEGQRALNISLAGQVSLDLDHRELSKIIDLLPRQDYEFAGHDYLTFEQAAQELRHPTSDYHPTSRYRMLLALLHRFGEGGEFAYALKSAEDLH